MILATAQIEDFDRFWNTFSTKGAAKRKQHGSKGSHVFRDPNEDDRLWVVSTGMRRAITTSWPIPRFRRSFRRRGSKVGPRRPSSPASTTPSRRPRIGPFEAAGLRE